ncbi:MAG: hypothetical protein PUP91_26405 [Rhizonema sp. PD37]|nr:hypothetical protein [Rhizonema sp. PD37]
MTENRYKSPPKSITSGLIILSTPKPVLVNGEGYPDKFAIA